MIPGLLTANSVKPKEISKTTNCLCYYVHGSMEILEQVEHIEKVKEEKLNQKNKQEAKERKKRAILQMQTYM